MSEAAEQQTSQEIDVDQLMEQVESGESERPLEAVPDESQQESQQAEEPAWQPPDWSEFDWKGKKIRPDNPEKAKQWLSLGYNYSQRAAELNAKEREYQTKLSDYDDIKQKYSQYSEVDKFAQENPEWWNHVNESFQKRETFGAPPEVAQHLEPILQKMQDLEQFKTEFQKQQEAQQQTQEDQALEQEIQDVSSKYSDIDLNAVDENGQTLEYRILNHAQKIGTNSFRAAFHDYLSDKLFEQREAKAREGAARDAEAKAKQGIIGQSNSPVKGVKPASVRGKSYEDLASEALAELGIN